MKICVQVSHSLGDDILIAHTLLGGENTVQKHALHQGHLFIHIIVYFACLNVRAELIKTSANKLQWRTD